MTNLVFLRAYDEPSYFLQLFPESCAVKSPSEPKTIRSGERAGDLIGATNGRNVVINNMA